MACSILKIEINAQGNSNKCLSHTGLKNSDSVPVLAIYCHHYNIQLEEEHYLSYHNNNIQIQEPYLSCHSFLERETVIQDGNRASFGQS